METGNKKSLFAVPIQKGNFCFPASLDSLLNRIFKEENVSKSLKGILQWEVLIKPGSEIGKSLLIKPLVLSYLFCYIKHILELHPHGKCNRSIPHCLIYKVFSCTLLFKILRINYFLDFVCVFKMGKYISIMTNTHLLVSLAFIFFL